MGGVEDAGKLTQMGLMAVKKGLHPRAVVACFLPAHRPLCLAKRLPAQPHKLFVSQLAAKEGQEA